MNNREIEAARAYHEITKHSYTSVRGSPHHLDWDNRPLPYKIYPDAPAIALPRDLQLSRMPALRAISQTVSDSATPLDLDKIARILFCADGLTRHKQAGGEDYHFRAAPSAGALYPIEIYLAAGEIDGLAPGLYHFSPADLKLRALREGDFRANLARDTAESEALLTSGAVLILSSIFWRSAWKYRARAYRYCFWDAGTILANLLAAAVAEEIACEVVTAFIDAEVEQIIGVDGEREAVTCLVAIGKAAPAVKAAEISRPLEFESAPLSASEVVYGDLASINRASRLDTPAEVKE
ncbi:MAG: SagB/ThcOx family dehydrogenase, partial [Candidatus Binataceae bacterium]